MRVSVETDASQEDVQAVVAGLRDYNIAFIGPPNQQPMRVFLRDDSGEIVGGLLGEMRWRWAYVEKLWVSDSHRGQGHGSALLAAGEAHARAQGCIGIYLDTFEYQARPFYEKHGYTLFGTLEGYPPGFRQYFLSKRLS